MGEVINVLVAFAVIIFVVRWATSGGSDNGAGRRARSLLGFQPKNVTPEMISTVQTMFPHVPRNNIHYDLLRTGDTQITSNKLLERGYLDSPPPAYLQLYPSNPATNNFTPPTERPSAAASSSSISLSPKSNLISRFNLEDRVHSDVSPIVPESDAGGKATWEDTAEKREASLRERKAQMVLAARKRLLEQQEEVVKK